MQIDLNSNERKIILDALRHPAYKDKISHPKTKFEIRKVYKIILDKLENDEILSRKIKETVPEVKIVLPGKDN
jgi:hypothetical protein